MKSRNNIFGCILLISIISMSIEIGNSTVVSGQQIIGIYEEILEDGDRKTTPPIYLCIGDSIRLNLTVIPYLDQNSGVIVEIYTPDDVIKFAENRTDGIKTVNISVLLNASSSEGNYWFEVLNPGSAGGDEMRVFGQCFYYHVDVLPDPITSYDPFQDGDWLTYDVDHRFDVQYTVTSRDPDYIHFENDNPYSTGWDIIMVHTNYQPLLEFDLFHNNIVERNFMPLNYNLSALEENLVIDPVFYDAQTLVQTNSGVKVIESTIKNETIIIDYITTIEYTIGELIPVKGVSWEYHTYSDTDNSWTNYSVRLQVHEPTGIPIYLDMTFNETDSYSNQKFLFRLIDSHGVFTTKEFPIEDIIEYVTEIIVETSWVTKETVITRQTTDFVALSFIALAIIGIVVKRRNKN